MNIKYPMSLKAKITYEICVEECSTKGTAKRYGIPLKTVENWVTAYHKDSTIYRAASLPDAQRIAQLEKEFADLRRKNEILKKMFLLKNENV